MADRKLTAKQDKFAVLMATTTKSQVDAYKEAYNCKDSQIGSLYTSSCLLAKNPRIMQRIAEIKEATCKHLRYDAAAHFKELEQAQELAMIPSGKHGTTDARTWVKAAELKGKMTGLYVERQEVTGANGEPLIPTAIEIKGLK